MNSTISLSHAIFSIIGLFIGTIACLLVPLFKDKQALPSLNQQIQQQAGIINNYFN